MGFRYRKSMNFGPFRANLSKSGLGYSLGGRGFRVESILVAGPTPPSACPARACPTEHPGRLPGAAVRNRRPVFTRVPDCGSRIIAPRCLARGLGACPLEHGIMIKWKRTLRTASSERFIAVQDSTHRGRKSPRSICTTCTMERSPARWCCFAAAAKHGPKTASPTCSPRSTRSSCRCRPCRGNLLYTVVMGEVVGSYQAERDDDR